MRKLAGILRAILSGAASVLDIGAGAEPPRYRGPESDAEAIRGDVRRVGDGLRKAMRKGDAQT